MSVISIHNLSCTFGVYTAMSAAILTFAGLSSRLCEIVGHEVWRSKEQYHGFGVILNGFEWLNSFSAKRDEFEVPFEMRKGNFNKIL